MQTDNEHFDLLTREEQLCDELMEHVSDGPFGLSLKHPMVFVVLGLDTNRSAMWNRQLAVKKKYVAEAMEEGKWSAAIWMHERPYRLEYFTEIQNRMTDEDYWSILASIIVDSENLWQYDTLLRMLLCNPMRMSSRHLLMDENEREALVALPEEFTIWRGCRWQNRFGLSWTTDKDKAIWFAKRLGCEKPRLHSGTVAKPDVIAHFLGREENEIFVIHNRLKNRKLQLI
jgi:hypothetical protein